MNNLFFETVRLKDGILFNIDLHNKRLNNTRSVFFNKNDCIDLSNVLKIKQPYSKGLYKIKIIYSDNIEGYEITSYKKRIINSLSIVIDDNIDYRHKYLDRTHLDLLKDSVDKDDIIIVKNGCLTDASFANIVLFDGKDLITPQNPLFKGIQREYLLKHNKIKEADIKLKELHKFKSIKLINAMNPIEDCPIINIENIT